MVAPDGCGVEAVVDDLVARTPGAVAAVRARLPAEFPMHVADSELKRLWFYRRPGWAQKAWEQWCEQAPEPDSCSRTVRPAPESLLARHHQCLSSARSHRGPMKVNLDDVWRMPRTAAGRDGQSLPRRSFARAASHKGAQI